MIEERWVSKLWICAKKLEKLLLFENNNRGQDSLRVAAPSAKRSRIKGIFLKCNSLKLLSTESKQSTVDCAKFDRSPRASRLMRSTHAD